MLRRAFDAENFEMLVKLILVLFGFFECCFGNVSLKINEESLQKEEIEFLSYVIKKYSNEKNGFVINNINSLSQKYVDFLTKKLFEENIASTIYDMTKAKFEWPQFNDHNMAVIIFDPNRSVKNMTNQYLQQIKPSRAKIILIFTTYPSELASNQEVLGRFAQLYNLNVLFIFMKNKKLVVLTFNQFLPKNQIIVDLTATKYTTDLYYNKLTDLGGLQINGLHTTTDRTRVRLQSDDDGNIKFSGKDYEVFETIFGHVNGRIKILMVHDYLKDMEFNPFAHSNTNPNKTLTKKRIVGEQNIAFLVHSQSLLEDDDVFENTYPHSQDDVVVFLGKAPEIPWSLLMLRIYKIEAIVFFFGVHLAAIALVISIQKLRNNRVQLTIFLDIARHTILCSFSRRMKFPIERLIMLGLISFSFIMNTTMQCRMTSIMSRNNYEKDVDTIEELGKSGTIIYGYGLILNEVKKKYEGINNEMVKNLRPLPPMAFSFDEYSDLAYEADVSQLPLGGVGIVTNYDRAVFVTRVRKFRNNGRPIFHLMRESLIPSFQSFKVKYGSIFLGLIEKSLRRLQEGGFLKLWAERTIYEATVEGLLYPSEDYDDSDHHAQSIDLEKINGCFIILITGCVASFLVFLFEHCYYISSKRCTNTTCDM